MTDANVNNWYSTTFKAWQAKRYGAKPTAEMLDTIHNLGARPGKQAMACAMALRDEGVTNAQIVQVCGAPQLNKMRGFTTDGLLKRIPTAPDALNHQVYKLELTPKGNKRVEAMRKRAAADEAVAADEPAKPTKAVAKPKARVVAAKVKKPVSEPAKAIEGHVTAVPAVTLGEADTAAQLPANQL